MKYIVTMAISGKYQHRYWAYNNIPNTPYSGRWHFICLPFDCKVGDITTDNDARFAIRYYDGANRAVNGTGGNWKDYSSDAVIPAGTGFIFQTNKECQMRFTSLDNETKQNVVSNKIFVKALEANNSEQSSNKGWNLVGNPWLCYYNIHKMNFTAPITVYDGYNRKYTAYSVIDDDYAILPYQAFFVQCPDEVNSISFPVDGRQMTSVIESQNGSRQLGRPENERKLIEAGKDIVKKIVEGIKNKFNDVRNSGKDIVTKISDGIKNSFNTIKSKASELINAFKSKIVESAQNLVSSGAEIVVKIAYGIGTGFNNITNKVYELKDRIVQAVEACASWWENLGYNIVRGIADGITKFGDWVKSAILNLVNSAWESVKEFFGIESPSKLMKWAGQMIDEGLAKGISDNSDDVQDAMDELNGIVSEPLDAGFSSSTSYSDSRNASTTGGITINVYGAVGQDVNELAEIVAQKLENAVQRKKAVFA